MRHVRYLSSSLYLEPPPELSDRIIRWSRSYIGDDEIFVSDWDKIGGRENEIHITLLYGIQANQESIFSEILKDTSPIIVKLGTIDLFIHHDLYDVMNIKVESGELRDLNKRLRENVHHKDRYHDYVPHITIGFLKKNKGWRHFGRSEFLNVEFCCKETVFASNDGEKYRFQIGR